MEQEYEVLEESEEEEGSVNLSVSNKNLKVKNKG